jgi:hypothetical protein
VPYLHVEVEATQTPRFPGHPCGDVVAYDRTPAWTTIVCCDGIGHGVTASIAANLYVSRLRELVRGRTSLHRAFEGIVRTLAEARGTDKPWAALSVAHILNNGQATILAYEAPAAILASRRHASVLPRHSHSLGTAVIEESTCHLEPGDALFLVTDGVTQAGLGTAFRGGWGIERAAEYVTDMLRRGTRLPEIAAGLHERAVEICGSDQGDDCTAVGAVCRWGRVLNILTGPPKDPARDAEVVKRFLLAEGSKVICGATTAELVARSLGTEVVVDRQSASLVAPPKYVLEGVDLVTEGAVTLNQVYNVLDEAPEAFEEESGVTELHDLLDAADRVSFLLGKAENPAHRHISFRQKGILPRHKIVELLAARLESAGKLVSLERF